jgi:hypothetical protein
LNRLSQSAGEIRLAFLTRAILKGIAEHIPGNASRQSSHYPGIEQDAAVLRDFIQSQLNYQGGFTGMVGRHGIDYRRYS